MSYPLVTLIQSFLDVYSLLVMSRVRAEKSIVKIDRSTSQAVGLRPRHLCSL